MTDFITTHLLDAIATIVGLIYIWLEYRADIRVWIAGIIMPAIDIVLYFKSGLYADSAMAVYYTLAAAYGYAVWKWGHKHGQKEGAEMPITHFRRRLILPAAIVFFIAWGAIWWLLVHFTNSTVPLTDSFVNALSFIALWAMARKYVEQWLIWIVVDAIITVLYIYKGLVFKPSLYALYVIIAVFGYMKWKRMMKKEKVKISQV